MEGRAEEGDKEDDKIMMMVVMFREGCFIGGRGR